MDNINGKALIEQLIKLTKDNKIKWGYLDQNSAVYYNLKIEPKSPLESRNPLATLAQISSLDGKTFFDSDNSFITSIKDNYVVIYARLSDKSDVLAERLVLMLVPNTYKDVYRYVDQDNNSELLRLQTLVKSSFPNSLDIANDILKMVSTKDEWGCGSILVLKNLKTSNSMDEIGEYEHKI